MKAAAVSPRVAVAQMTSTKEVVQNLTMIAGLAQSASQQECDLLVLPECCALMQGSRRQLLQSAEAYGDGPIQQAIAKVAKESGLWIIAGTVPLHSSQSDKVFNSCLVFDDQGRVAARYDKMHLFDVELSTGERYAESDYTVAGDSLGVVETPLGNIGLSICYDLRFPELYRELVTKGATIFIVPSAFSVTTGRAHWQTLLQARAIENSCYVLAPAQVGSHASGRTTWGHSMIIDPWGEVLQQMPDGNGLIYAAIESHRVHSVRDQLPGWQHRQITTGQSD